MRTKSLIVLTITLFECIQLFGQENQKEVYIEFSVGNDNLNTAYGDNAACLSEIITHLKSARNDSSLDLVERLFCKTSSPEDLYTINRRVSEERLAVLEQHVRKNIFISEIQEEKTEPQPVATVNTAPEKQETDIVLAQPQKEKPFCMSIKTNLLYDALAIPNIGVEFYLGKSWSVSGNWMYGWWKQSSKHRYWRIYGGELAVRKWLGKKAAEKPLTGHHLGIYGQVFTYDFKWGNKGYMGGKPGETLWDNANYAAGVEYGYSLPVARRLNLDFTLGVGYWGGKYYEYNSLDGHNVWQATKQRHWFGPTKAEISLVWLLEWGSNNRKGGVK